MEKYYIIGAGGHASVIFDILMSGNIGKNYIVVGVFDDITNEAEKFGLPVFGVLQNAKNYAGENAKFILAIGDNKERQRLSNDLVDLPYFAAIHKTAVIGRDCSIGAGTVIMPNVVINACAVIGSHTIINTSAVIEHGCVISDFSHISPGVTLCGNVKVGKGAWVCAGATVIPKVTIGDNVTIGAGATVISDVRAGDTVVGTPARSIYEN